MANGKEEVVVRWQDGAPDDGMSLTAETINNNNTSRNVKSQAKDLFGKLNDCPIYSFSPETERAADSNTLQCQANVASQI